jgi:hypothetical protein
MYGGGVGEICPTTSQPPLLGALLKGIEFTDLLFVSRPSIGSNVNLLCNKANTTSKITAPMWGFVGV